MRAVSALDTEVSSLSTFTHDWSAWDDSYAFVQDQNTTFIQANLMDSTFIHYSLSLIAFINSSGHVIFAKAFDLQNQTDLPFPESFLENVSNSDLLWRFDSVDGHVDGILRLQEGPMLISSRPIITSDYGGPIRGAVVMGRSLDSQIVSSLSEQVHLPLTFYRMNDKQSPADFQSAESQLSNQDPVLVKPLNSSFVAGYGLLNDVYGSPSLVLRVEVTRDIYNQGLTAVSYIGFSVVALGIVFAVLLILLLEGLVLKRLAQLSAAMRQVDENGDLSKRVQATGKDELSDLSREFNNMLSALEDSRHTLKKHSEHLEEQVQSRTEELRRSEEKIRSILSASPNAITATDLQGKIVECNDETLRLHGFSSRDELIGKSALQLIAEKDHKKAMKYLKKTLEQGTVRNVEYSFVTKNGREFPAELSASVIRDGSGKPLGFVAISKDITQRQKMEKELVTSKRMAAIGELAGMVGHDLRNPLMGIAGAEYYLKSTLAPQLNEKQKQMLAIIEEDITYSNKIVNDLQDYSKDMRFEVSNTNPKKLLEESLSAVNVPENIRVLDETRGAPEIQVDPCGIKRVFVNVIKNAVDAMPEGGRLEIKTREIGGFLEFTFADTGAGMSQEILEKIGKPLNTTKARGMGFGLAICHRIVEAHEGKISVESALNKGTTVKVALPIKSKMKENVELGFDAVDSQTCVPEEEG